MNIKITAKLRPFSHIPGAACLIPGTCSVITAFPTLLKINSHEIKLNLTGPVRDFTLQQDLERNCVFVFGQAKEGYFRLRVEASDSGFDVEVEKGPLKSVHIRAEVPFASKLLFERLSLGNHKAQDWDQVQKRADLEEILPIFFCLGQKLPPILPQPLLGTARLLEFPEERNRLASALISFFKVAFTQMLVPRLIDDQHQGLVPDEPVQGSPFFLIQEGMKRVRSLFFKQDERRLAFLPHLPVSLHAGRMIGLQAPGIGEIDFEWSKKTLRCVYLRASTSGEVIFELQKELKSFRVGKKLQQKATEPLLLEAGKTYFLDRFQK
jgi:hypothetical protein